jgi:hypothetical protein
MPIELGIKWLRCYSCPNDGVKVKYNENGITDDIVLPPTTKNIAEDKNDFDARQFQRDITSRGSLKVGDEVFWIKGPFTYEPQKTEYNLSRIIKFTKEKVLIQALSEARNIYVSDLNLKKREDFATVVIKYSGTTDQKIAIAGSAIVKRIRSNEYEVFAVSIEDGENILIVDYKGKGSSKSAYDIRNKINDIDSSKKEKTITLAVFKSSHQQLDML